MSFNAGLLNTNLATDVIGQTKMDLATPVNIFNSLQANKRANRQAIASQKLADLTLSNAEKEAKRKEMASKIMQSSLNQNGTINAEKAIAGFNQNGFYDEAMAIQEKMAKVAKERFEEQQQLKKQQTEAFTELGKSASAVIDSPNGVEAFMKFREDAMKRGLPISEGLKNYMPVDEELLDGRLDPKVKQELDYYVDRTLTPEQRLAKQKAKGEIKTPEQLKLEADKFKLEQDKFGLDVKKFKLNENQLELDGKKLAKELDDQTKGLMPAEKAIQVEEGLRKEYINQNKEFQSVGSAYNRILASGSEPSAAGDLALIFNYMKMLDPGSTVRESEFATAQNAAGVPEQIRAQWKKVRTGERLDPVTRADFMKRSGMLMDSALKGYDNSINTYRQLSKNYGVNPNNVVIDLNPQTETIAPDEARKQKIGKL